MDKHFHFYHPLKVIKIYAYKNYKDAGKSRSKGFLNVCSENEIHVY